MPKEFNHYRSALELNEMDLPAVIATRKLNGRSSILAALVEHGAPLEIEAIAERLHGLGMGASQEALLGSLRRAWGASRALRKDKAGRLVLDVNEADARFLKTQVSLALRDDVPFARPKSPMPPDSEPLTKAELKAGLTGAYLDSVSGASLAAMVTEAYGPMDPSAINEFIGALTPHFRRLGDPLKGTARSPLVDLDDEGRLCVNPDASGLPAVRMRVRKLVRQARRGPTPERDIEATEARWAREGMIRRAEALTRRRRLVQVFAVDGKPVLVGHIDPFAPEAVEMVAAEALADVAWLPDCDVFIGVDVFDLVETLGIEPGHRRLVNLGPPQKTKSLGPRRPTVKLTTDLLIRNTLGNWAQLPTKTDIRKAVRARDHAQLKGMMEAALDTLCTYYWYGVQHRFVSAVYGDFDMRVRASFAESGDESIHGLVKRLLNKQVWMRVQSERVSDAPEDFVGVITRAEHWNFTLDIGRGQFSGPVTIILAIRGIDDA